MSRERHRFRSTRVSDAIYDTTTRELRVRFPDGNHYTYYNVPEVIWLDFISAPSAGRFLNEVLAKNYRGR